MDPRSPEEACNFIPSLDPGACKGKGGGRTLAGLSLGVLSVKAQPMQLPFPVDKSHKGRVLSFAEIVSLGNRADRRR